MNYILRLIPKAGTVMIDAHYRTKALAEKAEKDAIAHGMEGKPYSFQDEFGQRLTVFSVADFTIQFTSTDIATAIQRSLTQPQPAHTPTWPATGNFGGSSIQ